MKKPRFEFTQGDNPFDARIIVDGKELNGVYAVKFEVDADNPIPIIEITFNTLTPCYVAVENAEIDYKVSIPDLVKWPREMLLAFLEAIPLALELKSKESASKPEEK